MWLAFLALASAQDLYVGGHGTPVGTSGDVTITGTVTDAVPGVTYEVEVNGMPTKVDELGDWAVTVDADYCTTGSDHGWFTDYFQPWPRMARPFTASLYEVGSDEELDRERVLLYDQGDATFVNALFPNGAVEGPTTILTESGLASLESLYGSSLAQAQPQFQDAVDTALAGASSPYASVSGAPWKTVPTDPDWVQALVRSGILFPALVSYGVCTAFPALPVCTPCMRVLPTPNRFDYQVDGAIVDLDAVDLGTPQTPELEWAVPDAVSSVTGWSQPSGIADVHLQARLRYTCTPLLTLPLNDTAGLDTVEDTLTCEDVPLSLSSAATRSDYLLGSDVSDPNDVDAELAGDPSISLAGFAASATGYCADADHDAAADQALPEAEAVVAEVLEEAWGVNAPQTVEAGLIADLLHPHGVGMEPGTYHELDAILDPPEVSPLAGVFTTETTTSTFPGAPEPVTTVTVLTPEAYDPNAIVPVSTYDLGASWTTGSLNQILRARAWQELSLRRLTWDELGLAPPVGQSGSTPARGVDLGDFWYELGWHKAWAGLAGVSGEVWIELTLSPFVMTAADGPMSALYAVPQAELVFESDDGDVVLRVLVDATYDLSGFDFAGDTSQWVAPILGPPQWGLLMTESTLCDFDAASYDWQGACGAQEIYSGSCEGSSVAGILDDLTPALDELFRGFLDEVPAAQSFTDGYGLFVEGDPGVLTEITPGRLTTIGFTKPGP